jgi:hypothetical protein
MEVYLAYAVKVPGDKIEVVIIRHWENVCVRYGDG